MLRIHSLKARAFQGGGRARGGTETHISPSGRAEIAAAMLQERYLCMWPAAVLWQPHALLQLYALGSVFTGGALASYRVHRLGLVAPSPAGLSSWRHRQFTISAVANRQYILFHNSLLFCRFEPF